MPRSLPFAHRSRKELEAGLEDIKSSPAGEGILRMIVARPAVDARDVLSEGRLDLEQGLIGDAWPVRGSTSAPDGSANLDAQLTVMNDRGYAKFAARFGGEALRFVNTGEGLELSLRGRNARVLVPGAVRRGDGVRVVGARSHAGVGGAGVPSALAVHARRR